MSQNPCDDSRIVVYRNFNLLDNASSQRCLAANCVGTSRLDWECMAMSKIELNHLTRITKSPTRMSHARFSGWPLLVAFLLMPLVACNQPAEKPESTPGKETTAADTASDAVSDTSPADPATDSDEAATETDVPSDLPPDDTAATDTAADMPAAEDKDSPITLSDPNETNSTMADLNKPETPEADELDKPGLPMPQPEDTTDNGKLEESDNSIGQPNKIIYAWESEDPTPDEIAAKAFMPPAGAKPLSRTSRLWVDPGKHRVYVDGYVALREGALEMFACPVGTKEHESLVAVLARPSYVHAALLAADANPGTPAKFRPQFESPTGQVIRIWVCWYDQDGTFQVVDARQWVLDSKTQKALDAEWVFAGSGFWKDPDSGKERYLADSGDMICVSNFASAMLDISMASSAETDLLQFEPMSKQIPERYTPIRMIMVPVPQPTDDPNPTPADQLQKPTAETLVINPKGLEEARAERKKKLKEAKALAEAEEAANATEAEEK